MTRRALLLACLCTSVAAFGDAEESAGIVLRPLQATGLSEILTARRVLLEKRKGEPLRGHEWWLWGLSAFDYDGDADLDLIVCIHGSQNGLIIKNLWKETGTVRFADATAAVGVDGMMPSTDDYPLVWDFDGDGDLDIAGLLDDQPTPCLINQNGKRFVKAAFSLHPINHPGGVADLNGDGYLDIFQIRRGKRIECLYDPLAASFEKRVSPSELEFELPAEVKREIATLLGRQENRFLKLKYIHDHDLNQDGKQDLVVSGFGAYSGDRVGWYLLATDDNRFVDRTEALGLPHAGTPFAFQDLDQDGDLDVLIASGDRAGLYRNDGQGAFAVTPGPLTQFLQRRCPYLHVVFRADLDNDGDLDLAVSNRRYGQQRIFENLGAGRFGLVLESRGWDADPLVLGDFNDDGRVDVVIGGSGDKENIGVFINETPSVGNFCTLNVRMPSPNTYGVGTEVEIYSSGTLYNQDGRLNQDARPRRIVSAPLDGSPLHVGLGTETQFDIRVRFPGRPPMDSVKVEAAPAIRIAPDSPLLNHM